MSKEKAGANDMVAAQVHGPAEQVAVIGKFDAACWEKDDAGNLRQVWKETGHNVVVNQGRGALFNKAMGFQTASSFGMYALPHSATTGSNNVWSDISASRVISYGNDVPKITFATTYASGSATGTCSYGFTASTQTVSGIALAWYTANTMSSNAAAADILLYNQGQFGASQQVQSGNTLSVSVTLSLATA